MGSLAVLGLFLIAQNGGLADDALNSDRWQQFERRVRDGEIGLTEGRTQIVNWAEILEQRYVSERFDRRIYFPLKGYGVPSIGG
ncbi:MAG: hypothetical protein MUC57_17815, partial [Desulfobacterales bacterium]|nr:hypothetical protein [Desulfobacterales bacterium]